MIGHEEMMSRPYDVASGREAPVSHFVGFEQSAGQKSGEGQEKILPVLPMTQQVFAGWELR